MKKICLILTLVCITAMAGKTDIKGLWGDSETKTNEKSKKKFTPKASVSTVKNIKKNENVLSSVETRKSELNSKMGKIAKNIIRAESSYEKLLYSMKMLKQDMQENNEKYNTAKEKIDDFEAQIGGLDKRIDDLRDKHVKILIDQFSMSLAIQESKNTTINSFVLKETYDIYKQKSNKVISDLKSEMLRNEEKKKNVQGYQKKIENSISKITKKYDLYKKKKKEQKKLLGKLGDEEQVYRKNIKSLLGKQSMIRSTLAKLNIIKKQEIVEAKDRENARQREIKRRAEERRKARLAKAGKKVAPKSFQSKKSIKQLGKSYHKDKIYAYRGDKTISPIKGAKIVKSFGTYTDPIYKMKIFNESITLKAPTQDAVVRNVLNGRVVFAGENNMLGKVIIVENANKVHTIYAGLSKISPLIKKGTKVKKGAVVGRVKRKLIFEATKNSKYINPMRLISI